MRKESIERDEGTVVVNGEWNDQIEDSTFLTISRFAFRKHPLSIASPTPPENRTAQSTRARNPNNSSAPVPVARRRWGRHVGTRHHTGRKRQLADPCPCDSGPSKRGGSVQCVDDGSFTRKEWDRFLHNTAWARVDLINRGLAVRVACAGLVKDGLQILVGGLFWNHLS